MSRLSSYLHSSIGRKQIVAVTGLVLVFFVVGHLTGNLLLILGPEAFNGYAKKLEHLRPGLYLIEAGLFIIFLSHIFVTATLVLENIKARGGRYAVSRSVGKRSLATRLMPYTGTLLLAFVIWHLMDFTLVDKQGARSFINGQNFGLYGIVYNSFKDPIHSGLYIAAMLALGLHLSHGIQSFVQTFGINRERVSVGLKIFSVLAGYGVAIGFSLIPVYVLVDSGMLKLF